MQSEMRKYPWSPWKISGVWQIHRSLKTTIAPGKSLTRTAPGKWSCEVLNVVCSLFPSSLSFPIASLSVSSDQCRAHTAVSPPANQHPSQFQLNSSRLYSLIHSPEVAWDQTQGLTKLFCSSALQPEPQVSSKSTLLPSFLCCPTCVSHSPWPKQSPLTGLSLLQAPLPSLKGRFWQMALKHLAQEDIRWQRCLLMGPWQTLHLASIGVTTVTLHSLTLISVSSQGQKDLVGHSSHFWPIHSPTRDFDPQHVFLVDYQSSASYLQPNVK